MASRKGKRGSGKEPAAAAAATSSKRAKHEKAPEVPLPLPIMAAAAISDDEEELEAVLPKLVGTVSGNKVMDWEQEDINTLIEGVSKALNKNDNTKYSTAVEKMDWDKIKFGNYSDQECKEKWIQIMCRLRRYRTLTDMVKDAQVWAKQPWSSYNNSKKTKHPDMPKKPLTPFFRYFMEKRQKVGKSNPGMSVTDLAKLLSTKFSALTEKKKQKYKDSYDKEYQEFKLKLGQFKKDHPEVEMNQLLLKESLGHGKVPEGPAKPRTPYQLYLHEKMLKNTSDKKKEAIDGHRHSWSSLSDGKRIKWIRKSLDDEKRFQAEVIEYKKTHPNYDPLPLKSTLNKMEKALKDRYDGKPDKPPNSGYSLFSKLMLRQLKVANSKEKMVQIANRWKELDTESKQNYNREAQKAASKYVEKFEQYLTTLPEADRVKAVSESKVKLPSEKKLKEQLASAAGTSSGYVAADDPAVNQAALLLFQSERMKQLQDKNPEKTVRELITIICHEWNNQMTDKKKAKYLKSAQTSYGQSSVKQTLPKAIQPALVTATKSLPKGMKPADILKREPKRPPKSGYALYTAEQLSKMVGVEPKRRMSEIAKKWNSQVTKEQKSAYDQRSKEMTAKYGKELDHFKKTLSPEEMRLYNEYLASNKAGKGGKGKAKAKGNADPVVDDSNVFETITVSTTDFGNNANEAETSSESGSDSESGSESEESAEGEQEEQEQEPAQASEEESGESESESEAGSDSDSDSSE